MKKRIGLYPGTFDPLTLGHVDIIGRDDVEVFRLREPREYLAQWRVAYDQ